MNQVAIELKKVSKRFGEVVANNQVDLKVYKNEILLPNSQYLNLLSEGSVDIPSAKSLFFFAYL